MRGYSQPREQEAQSQEEEVHLNCPETDSEEPVEQEWYVKELCLDMRLVMKEGVMD